MAAHLFTRGASSKGEGRGYGLAGVQARVRALGGEMRYTRREGRTVFQVNLPPPAIAPAARLETV
ncbi:MAG: ATP-binding protein [Deinococcota bacterium]